MSDATPGHTVELVLIRHPVDEILVTDRGCPYGGVKQPGDQEP